MTIFGNRDFGQRDLSAVGSEGTNAAVDDPGLGAAAPAAPVFAVDTRRVVLRMHGDQDIVVGRAEGREPAVEIAREMVRHIEAASARGEWPQIDERFVRPGAIVSVDVQRGE